MGPKKSSSPKLQFFKEGDAVMAADVNFTSGGTLYNAKIIRAHKVDVGVFKYLVHYTGWKRKFDVWMESSQLALVSDASAVQKLAAEQMALHQSQAKKSGKPIIEPSNEATLIHDTNEVETRSRSSASVKPKRGHDELLEEDRMIKRNKAVLSASDLTEEKEDDVLAMADIDLPMPLKKKLVNEWSLISEKDPKRLLRLPRPITVRQIFSEYVDFKKSKEKLDGHSLKNIEEFCDSLMIYFDRALPVILLYRHEREQYSNASLYMEHKKLMPSDVYGAEHLSRLFVRLTKMLTGVAAKQEEMSSFKDDMSNFLKFFSKNVTSYFTDEDYRVASDVVVVEGFVANTANAAASTQ